ncbi:uncharacterized protein LAESUDRAFT_729307 [Laetiporus sulphureus 93-53]|uniref:Uncharacterized protein n=1 Tax=Laetiporus sulphureus 93-53 TaxID=1314785 RepID=A0A165CR10_9APHY|nr:uncharacterized protein LAESUDRAFT_729307 [Laetiporus sulphureus 93-53]KZT03269.1 hypothetical protein LAESUDRAFT_729307 [Laetiporus sulphureus 93-53]
MVTISLSLGLGTVEGGDLLAASLPQAAVQPLPTPLVRDSTRRIGIARRHDPQPWREGPGPLPSTAAMLASIVSPLPPL